MARKGQSERNARAQERLRQLGHDAGPLRGAENRLRKALGSARGLSAGQAVGKPRKGEQLVSRLRAEGRLPAPQRRVAPIPRRDVELPAAGAKMTTTTDMRHLAGQLRAAARAGQRVSFHITASDERGTRTKPVGGTAAQQAFVRQRAQDQRTAGNHRQGQRPQRNTGQRTAGDSGVRARGRVRMAAASGMAGGPGARGSGAGEGFDPDDILDWLDSYSDPWEAWGDLWDVEDSG